jgi:A/G-specific adenine glycosylase
MTSALLTWFEGRRDRYPWRRIADPYAVLVSEVMLQQTQAARVAPHFERFMARFPHVGSLAEARRSDVVREWDGLGYNRRAVSLSEAARAIVREHGAIVPSEPMALRSLPGVGPYTAAAVSSIAFGVPVAAVDTNARRVVARVRGGIEASSLDPREIDRLAQQWLAPDAPGDHNQAVMDLGRECCRPVPRCDACPLMATCRSAFRVPRARPARRRAVDAFDGSTRQLRGAVVRALRGRRRSLASLSSITGVELERVHAAVASLARDGVVSAGPSALRAAPSGIVRLAG